MSKVNWQPIETAPKDGSQILTWRRHTPWIPASKQGDWYQTSFWSDQYKVFVGWPKAEAPTHWQPLPDPPCPDCEGKGCVECDGPDHRSA